MLRIGFQFGLQSSAGKGAPPPANTPGLAATPHSFRVKIMSSSKSELSELSAEKKTRRLGSVGAQTRLRVAKQGVVTRRWPSPAWDQKLLCSKEGS